MEDIWVENLIDEAQDALQYAYCPYSEFAVGAAVLTETGEIFKACNVENASYSLSLCAERAAIAKAVSEGRFDIRAIAVYHDGFQLPYPCGSCLQVIAEFNTDADIIIASDTTVKQYKLVELLPKAFSIGEENE